MPDSITTSYLGYRIELRERVLTIYSPNGARISAGKMSFSTARRIIKGYRKAA